MELADKVMDPHRMSRWHYRLELCDLFAGASVPFHLETSQRGYSGGQLGAFVTFLTKLTLAGCANRGRILLGLFTHGINSFLA